MATQKGGKKGRNGDKKKGRAKRKALGRGSALALFVRNKTSAEAYFNQTGQR